METPPELKDVAGDGDEITISNREYDDESIIAVDFGPTGEHPSVDVVDDTAIVTVGGRQFEFDVPTEASDVIVNDGVLTIKGLTLEGRPVVRRSFDTRTKHCDDRCSPAPIYCSGSGRSPWRSAFIPHRWPTNRSLPSPPRRDRRRSDRAGRRRASRSGPHYAGRVSRQRDQTGRAPRPARGVRDADQRTRDPQQPAPSRRRAGRGSRYRTPRGDPPGRPAFEVGTVTCFSGLPAGSPTDETPNWITAPWPPQHAEALEYQWERAIEYWGKIAEYADDHGIDVAIEMHPNMLIYEPHGMARLREETGERIGANVDPSHLYWRGITITDAIRYLGERQAIHHVHAKDTRIYDAKARERAYWIRRRTPTSRIGPGSFGRSATAMANPTGRISSRRFA